MKKWIWLVLFGMVVLMLAPQGFTQIELDKVSGKVTAVDLVGKKLTVTGTDGVTYEFVLGPGTTIWKCKDMSLMAGEEKELSYLAVGMDVVVEYMIGEKGKIYAMMTSIIPTEKEVFK